AHFSDSNANVAGDFTATIDWGDGSGTDPGTITAASGGYDVSGTHTYPEEGASFALNVTFTDDGAGTATDTANSTAHVTDAALAMAGKPLTGSEDVLVQQV